MAKDEKSLSRELVNSIREDLSDRKDWRVKLVEHGKHRLGQRKQSSLYPGSPNFLEPIIDDNVRSGVAQEVAVLFSSRQIANFIPLDMAAAKHKRNAEVAFDTMVRLLTYFRTKAEHILDTKRETGMAVVKLTENNEAYSRYFPDREATLPDCEAVDPLDVVVPMITKRISKAERICEMHKYTPREFKKNAAMYGWQNAEKVLAECRQSVDGGKGDAGDEGAELTVGLDIVNSNIESIHVWEIYHYDEDGDRQRTLIAPARPELVLQSIPWRWPSKIVMDPMTGELKEVPGKERPWPYVQFRHENRKETFYDTRGDAELLLDNQKAATQYANAKGVQLDFFAKPIISGPRDRSQKLRIRPGEFWPDGTGFVQMPKVDGIFDMSSDIERAKAARRSGAGMGSFADQRMGGREKTATQVNAEGLSAQRLTNTSVLRDGEPFSELFGMMWEWLQHNPVDLPMINESRMIEGTLSQDVLTMPFKVESAANSQNVNPDFVLQTLMTIGPMLGPNPFVRQDKFAMMLVDQVNPQMTRELVADPNEMGPNGQMPIAAQTQQNTQMLQQLSQQVTAMMGYLQQLAQTDAADDGMEATA